MSMANLFAGCGRMASAAAGSLLVDVKSNLVVGENVIVLEVSSHTAKGLNDVEARQYPALAQSPECVSGVGFCLRLQDEGGQNPRHHHG